MVMKTMPVPKTTRAVPLSLDALLVRSTKQRSNKGARSKEEAESEAGDVIDLGAPRRLRRAPREPRSTRTPKSRQPYTPNPRLYPGPRPKPKRRPKRAEARGGESRGRRRKRVFRRPVPNARLYRPAPPRPPPPPAWPRATWPPPVQRAPLDTASRAALRLSERRAARTARSPARAPRPPPPLPPPAPPPPPAHALVARRLVVTVPAAPAELGPRYRPASGHFQLLSLDTDSGASTPVRVHPPVAALAMDAANCHSTSPEDCSDGNETLSAPSEFLAEFLSAIMRRQYAEALKYCRLILQYEPHNATARGFFPLLQHKVQAHKRAERAEWPRGSSSEEASAHSDKAPPPATAHAHELMEQDADESEGSGSGAPRSCSWSRSRSRSGGSGRSGRSDRSGESGASQSSLELDSSDALAHSSPSLSLSRRTDHTDSASGGCWDSAGSASRSEPDDNGNTAAPENDNASSATTVKSREASQSSLRREASQSSLRRLRAQFACSIK